MWKWYLNSGQAALQLLVDGTGRCWIGWDKEFLESNLHVYGGDDTKIVIYSMGRWPKGVGGEKIKKSL